MKRDPRTDLPTDRPHHGGDEMVQLPQIDDVIADLRRILPTVDGLPAAVREAARAAFLTRDLDAEIAALVTDSRRQGSSEAVRADQEAQGRWQLSFCGCGVLIDMEVDHERGRLRLLGHVLGGAAECRLESDAGLRPVELDALGRFVIDGLQTGPIRLRCRLADGRQLTTAWVTI
jgi:hypothetical protein